MSSEQTVIVDKSGSSKSVITYVAIILVFLVALFLSSQSEGPSKLPKVVTDEFTFTAWVNEGEDFLKNAENRFWQKKFANDHFSASNVQPNRPASAPVSRAVADKIFCFF